MGGRGLQIGPSLSGASRPADARASRQVRSWPLGHTPPRPFVVPPPCVPPPARPNARLLAQVRLHTVTSGYTQGGEAFNSKVPQKQKGRPRAALPFNLVSRDQKRMRAPPMTMEKSSRLTAPVKLLPAALVRSPLKTLYDRYSSIAAASMFCTMPTPHILASEAKI